MSLSFPLDLTRNDGPLPSLLQTRILWLFTRPLHSLGHPCKIFQATIDFCSELYLYYIRWEEIRSVHSVVLIVYSK
jgi:hypothetical protein